MKRETAMLMSMFPEKYVASPSDPDPFCPTNIISPHTVGSNTLRDLKRRVANGGMSDAATWDDNTHASVFLRCLSSDVLVNDRIEALRLLLDNGLDLKRYDHAIFSIEDCEGVNKHELLRLAISHGINVHARDGEGKTRLMRATRASDLETMRILLMAGADVHCVSNSGDSVFSLCLLCFSPDVWVEGLAYGAYPTDSWTPYKHTFGKQMYLLAEMQFATHQPSARRVADPAFARDLRTRVYALSWQLFCTLAMPICFALQAIELPVLLTLEILDELLPMAHMHTMHRKWKLIQTIKHFHAPLP
jgi:hypothetical protein